MPSKRQIRSHGTLLFVLAYIASTYKGSPTWGRPIQSAVFLLFSCGIALLLFQEWFLSLSSLASSETKDDGSRPSSFDFVSSKSNTPSSSKLWDTLRSIPKPAWRQSIAPVALAICLRIEIFHFIARDSRCIVASLEGYLPFVIAIHDFWTGSPTPPEERLLPTADTDEWGMPSSQRRAPKKTILHIFCSLLLGIASSVSLWATTAPPSTFICATGNLGYLLLPLLRCFALLLVAYILLRVEALLKQPAQHDSSVQKPLPILGSVFLKFASIIFSLFGGVNVAVHLQYWQWFFNFDWRFIWSLLGYMFLSAILMVACLRMIADYGAFHLSFIITTICLYTPTIIYTLTYDEIIPIASTTTILSFLVLLYLGAGIYLKSAVFTATARPKTFTSLFSLLLVATLGLTWSYWPATHYLNHHPIDALAENAAIKAGQWLAQASTGQNLQLAVRNYKARYGRPPPPGFDLWYRYATQRSSVIIDDFDSMYEDLEPFWSISPAEIRRLTWQLTDDGWNDLASVKVRRGQLMVGPNYKPTHYWMLEGFTAMMDSFAQHIPDMEIALNLNDEPRVAVPYSHMQRHLRDAAASQSSTTLKKLWSPERGTTWKREGKFTSRPFGSYPRTNSFSAATVGCPSTSPARREDQWDARVFCSSCTSPHSYGSILSNWTIAMSPCHQPDLRNLHGLYLSPSAFKTSHQLLPIFSQSKVSGFADILYPSPWNYMDKVKYQPSAELPDAPFSQKLNSLFWRGTTSEGLSRYGLWKSMTRQRFVHLANNLTSSNSSSTLPMLLPSDKVEGRYSVQYPRQPYQHVTPTLNVSFTGIDRAWDSDRPDQEAFFSITNATDFQEHWRHRYLFDTDGAGFSGRFIPFLQSHSLPFRSGMFRAWYDGRLTVWAHFVPIDLRLQGLLSTLAYFAGTNGVKGAKTLKARVGMEKKEKVAEKIAESGREWAGKVLRREDMEIYLFRLLLEWGRITDDERENLGFALDGEKGM